MCMHQVMAELGVIQDVDPASIKNHSLCKYLLIGVEFPRCRRDNGSVCVLPIYASFGPQNITVIMSQESHYWNAFLIGFTKTHFLHPPKYGSYGSYYTPLERYE